MSDSLFTPGETAADLDKLEKLMRRLATEYEMYLSKMVKWPPHQRLAEINAMVRHYTKEPPRRTVERFRFNTIVHRLHTSLERWSRRMRALELSGSSRLTPSGARTKEHVEDLSLPQILSATRLSSGQATGDQIRDVYLAYKQARKARGLPVQNLSYAPFANSLRQSLEIARDQNGTRDLELRVDEVGGKVRISVKPVRAEETADRSRS